MEFEPSNRNFDNLTKLQPRGGLIEDPDPRLGDDVVHDLLQVAGLFEHFQLPVGASAHLEHLVNVIDLFSRSKLIYDGVNQLKVFQHQIASGNFFLFAEINQFSLDSVTRGAKLVLHDERTAIDPIALIGCMQLVQHGHGRLDQRCNSHGFVEPHGNVAYPYLEGVKEWMRADVPPDFLAVIDAMGLDQKVDEGLVFRPVGENIGNVGSREPLKHFTAVRFKPGIHTHPEGRVRRQRQDMRQEVPHGIHDVDGGIAVLNADVDVQSENQVGARDELHVLDHLRIAFVGINLLQLPV